MWEVAVAVVLIGIIFYFLNLVKNFDEEHGALKLLFLFGSFFLMLISINLTVEFATWQEASANIISGLTTFYLVCLWITILTVGYMVVYWIFKLLLKLGTITDKKKSKFNFISKGE